MASEAQSVDVPCVQGPRVDAHTQYLSKTLPHVSIGPELRLGAPNTDSVLELMELQTTDDMDDA